MEERILEFIEQAEISLTVLCIEYALVSVCLLMLLACIVKAIRDIRRSEKELEEEKK